MMRSRTVMSEMLSMNNVRQKRITGFPKLEIQRLDKSVEAESTESKGYQVFISHSQKDNQGRLFFKNLFAQTNSSAFFYADHKFPPPHSKRIIDEMRKSSSLFVLLSPEMEVYYTMIWIAFEVGVAKALDKNVWVFENPRSQATNVPVPGLDAYVQRPAKISNVDSYGFKKVIEQGGLVLPYSLGIMGKSGTRFTRLIGSPFDEKRFKHVGNTVCPNVRCKHAFFRATLKGITEYLCPSCRTKVTFKK